MWRNIQLADRFRRFRIAALLVVLTTVQIAQASPDLSRHETSLSSKGQSRPKEPSKPGAKQKGDANKAVQVFSFNGAKEVDGLELKQEYRFIGKSTTYFSPLGIRLESNTLSVLFNSKTQALCIYSDETKKFYACNPETWKKKSKILFQTPTDHPKLSAWKLVREEKVAGMNTKAYSRFSYMKSMTNEDTIWVTNEIQLTPDARRLLYSLLKVIDTVPAGVPLRHALLSKHKKTKDSKADFLGRRRVRQMPDVNHVDYETFSIKKVKIPVSKYVMPPGYKKAESEMEVFFSSDDAIGGPEIPEFGLDEDKKRMLEKLK